MIMKKKLAILFQKYGVKNISCDSRNLNIGDVFFAIKGKNFNGNDFINHALTKAALVITDDQQKEQTRVIYFQDIKSAINIAVDIIYPLKPINLLAVTGTNGKSSVVSYIHQILTLLGEPSASLGTLGISANLKTLENSLNENFSGLTTPSFIDFRKILHKLAKESINNLAFEASSHAIDQNRIGNLQIKSAGFVSFSQDHLDYHGNMENYLRTKLSLLVANLSANGLAVINEDIISGEYASIVKDFLIKNNINYILVGKNSDIKITKLVSSLKGIKIAFSYNQKKYLIQSVIVGSFQAVNLLIAAAMVENLGIDFNKIANILDKITSVSGRLQRVGDISDYFHVFVDYAHTPDALEKSLLELKKLKKKKGLLYVIFGCGGDRDISKRELMGQIAEKLADNVIITDDNPRGEDAAKIRADIIKAAPNAVEIADRAEAIEHIINMMQPDDIVLIAGKGHENYQIIGNKKIFFSDYQIAKNCLNNKD